MTTTITTVRKPRNRRNKKVVQKTVTTEQQPTSKVKTGTKLAGTLTYPEFLSNCAKDYLSVLENPWSGKVACVPNIPSIPSRKIRYWNKGICSTGTDGFGYVVFNPFNITNAATAMNETAIFFSSSGFSGTTIHDTTGSPAGVTPSQLNGEYDTATLNTNAVKFRLVAAGLRVRYNGTELNRGGRIFALEEPDHGDMIGYGIGDFAKYDSHRVFRPDQQWKSVVFHPADEDEFDYFTFGGRLLPYFLGIVFDSPSSDVITTYEYEAVAIYELIGSAVRGITQTPADIVGLSAVQAFTNRPETRVARSGDRTSFVNAAINAAGRLLVQSASGLMHAYFQRPAARAPIRILDTSSTSPLGIMDDID